MDDASLRTKIIEHLEAVRPRGRPVVPISEDTELWYDLGIYGDELFDLAIWARDALGVEPNLDIKGSAPSESPFQFLWLRLGRKFRVDHARSRYPSFTVRDVIAAAKAGRWHSA
jgi:hypothetical protein